ncbi:MAG: NUDIX domain-containing protein [Paludibacteraceae bacterium]|jgi:isopentenyldiphosphate isomerase|nr:NUDIX domain-containing protein [Paludibacteraceae bacterium]
MTEYFPVVTIDGDVVAKALRQDCHNGSHILHPVVHLHVFSSKGELYLQRRAMHKDLLPGYWDTAVGGHVIYGETIQQALMREVQEEIGITHFTPIHLETYRYDSSRESEMVHVYKTVYDGPFHWNDGEVMDGRFWSIDQLRQAIGQGVLTPNLELELQRFQIV